MIVGVKFDGLRKFLTARQKMSDTSHPQGREVTYAASWKSLAANALLPSALRASAMVFAVSNHGGAVLSHDWQVEMQSSAVQNLEVRYRAQYGRASAEI